MNTKKETFTTAVIVARFQVHELTEAHRDLIQTVINEHPKVLIFLGLSPVKGSTNNPLEFQPRKQMILEAFPADKYPNITIGYIKDQRDDKLWSANLDKLITDLLSPNDTVVLYGGRDSFLERYSGSFPTRELTSNRYVSGTEIRRLLAEKPQSDPLFRAGAIYNAYQRFPTVYSTVDVAVLDPKQYRTLLARKPGEKLFRFVGGFVAPTDNSFEEAATRELGEEAGIPSGPLTYIGSRKVDDWRYRNEVDKIITHLFLSYYVMGAPRPGDDVAEVEWFDLAILDESQFVEEHRPLYKMLLKHLEKGVTAPQEGGK